MNKRDILKIAALVVVLVLVVLLVGRIDRAQGREETEIVRDAIKAVKNAALTCYAVEGAYPDDIDYLRENYQLAYNEDQYFVTYEAFASNRIPDIWVTERGKK